MTARIHLALAFDDNFWAPAYATMRSVCLASRRRQELVFHLCHPALRRNSIVDLERIGTEFGATLVHHDLDADPDYRHFAASLPHTRHISAVMYARMLFDRIIPKEVDRLIYLDCDVLARAPIEELAEADLQGRPLGAVKELNAWRFTHGRDAAANHDLFDSAEPMFFSGMLVIDLAAWRKIDMAKTLRELEANGTLARFLNDQQILNYIFKGRWTRLDGRWNMLARGRAIEVLDPALVHYSGPNKPWNLISGLPFARTYRHVMTNELFYRYMRHRWARWWLGLPGRLFGRR